MVVIAPALECHAVTLTVNATNGSVTATPDKTDYNIGEVVELKPKPNTGYYFSGWAGDARGKRLVLNVTMDTDKTITANFDTWQPPIGIPVPDFGIFETHMMYQGQTYDFGSGPELYKDAGNGPYTHYVDNTHPMATDTGNTYGTADIPRNTIPSPVAKGSVVEIHGGPYTHKQGSHLRMDGIGTAERPIFYRGAESDSLVRIAVSAQSGFVNSAKYIIIERMSFYSYGVNPSEGASVGHIALRHAEATGDISSGGIGIGSWITDNWISDIVIYDVVIHENGPWDTTEGDPGIGTYTRNLWIVDNQIYHNAGNGI